MDAPIFVSKGHLRRRTGLPDESAG